MVRLTVDHDDEKFMRLALRLAARGRGRVEPNPMVGCVVVRNRRIIGRGYHRRFGGPHAEVEALRSCDGGAAGATVYVTLEPCCFFGKTPACTDALRAAKVGRVVAAMQDPNPRVNGRGLAILRKAGIRTALGTLGDEAAALNAPFIKLVRQRRPWVILKWAQSLDGKIATAGGESKWITDEVMRAHAHRIRGRVDAIIVGRHTVQTDDPLLTCRAGRPGRIAVRVVLDSKLRISPDSQLVRTAREVPTWIFCAVGAPLVRAKRLGSAGCVVHRVPSDAAGAGGVSLPAVLDVLGAAEMTNVLVEGGGAVLGRFFDQHLADEVCLYVAPRLIGGRTAPGALNAKGVSTMKGAVALVPADGFKRLGSGWVFQGRLPK